MVVEKAGHFVFLADEGKELYDLLSQLTQTPNVLTINTTTNGPTPPNLVEQVIKVKELHQLTVNNDAEYRAIMKRLGIEIDPN